NPTYSFSGGNQGYSIFIQDNASVTDADMVDVEARGGSGWIVGGAPAVRQAQQTVHAMNVFKQANPDGVAYGTIFLGANDVCGPSLPSTGDVEAAITSVMDILIVNGDGDAPPLPQGSAIWLLSPPDFGAVRPIVANTYPLFDTPSLSCQE